MIKEQTDMLVTGFFARKVVKDIQNNIFNLDTLQSVEKNIQSILRGHEQTDNYSTSNANIIEDLHNYGQCLKIIEKIIPEIKSIKQLLDYVLTMLSEIHGAINSKSVTKDKLKKTYQYYYELRRYCINNFPHNRGCWY